MVCYHPLKAWRGRVAGKSGRAPVVFNVKDGWEDRPVTLPCGQCVGCRLERSRQWAVRCVHEAQLHEDNSFITLTYNNDHLPSDGSLDIRHFQLFMKRLRTSIAPRRIKFFHCGEYGSKYGRPHYHALLFGYDFADRRLHQVRNGYPIYISEELSRLWTMGFSSCGDLTFESAAYVARYIMKKVTGKDAEGHYQGRRPEYTSMSGAGQGKGIAHDWYEKYGKDVYPYDEVIMRGKRLRPPRYYDGLFEVTNPEGMQQIRAKRISAGRKHKADQTPERLKVREAIQKRRLGLLKRDLE